MRIKNALIPGVVFVLAATAYACASAPPEESQGTVKTLQVQVTDLSRQLAVLQHAQPEDQRAAMDAYWDMLKKQLQYARDLPGISAHGCKDWMLVDPVIAGAARTKAINPCPTVHDSGPVLGWNLPANLSPHLFTLMMQQQLGSISSQVDGIAAEGDAVKRADLYRRLYETRYQDIQTVLGREWMWAPLDPSTFPDAGSLGAELLQSYCSQCHNAPRPGLHTQAEWTGIIRKMDAIIGVQSRAQVMGIRMPSQDEFNLIVNYLEFHAADRP